MGMYVYLSRSTFVRSETEGLPHPLISNSS